MDNEDSSEDEDRPEDEDSDKDSARLPLEESPVLLEYSKLKAPNEWVACYNEDPFVRSSSQDLYRRWSATLASEVDSVMPIPPLRVLISQYAEFIWMHKLTVPIVKLGLWLSCTRLHSIIPFADAEGEEKSFLISLVDRHKIARVWPVSNDLIRYAGDGTAHQKQGPLLDASFEKPRGICADPTRKNHYFIADNGSIRCIDGVNISLIASGFGQVLNLCITMDGTTLYVADASNDMIRRVEIESGVVSIVAGGCDRPKNRDGKATECLLARPEHLVFYRSPLTKPDSVLFITSWPERVRRLDIETGEMITPSWSSTFQLRAGGICCTSNGTLIISCSRTHRLYAINPLRGCLEWSLAMDTGGISQIFDHGNHGLYVDETAHSLWAIGRGIQCVTLPPHLFW